MRRGRIFIYLALILVIGIVVVYLVYSKMLQPLGKAAGGTPTPTQEVAMVEVLILTQPVSRGDVVTEAVLKPAPIPRSLFYEGYITNLSDAVGKQARVDMEAGMFLTKNMLADSLQQVAKGGSNAALLIPQGMVAVSIPVNRLSSVSFAPQRGDHVNVIVTMLMIDLDPNFQSALPNNTAAVIAPGPAVLLGLGAGEKATASLSVQELLKTINAQVVGGGQASTQGRSEQDALLGQTLYLVPGESQRPRLVSQSLIQDVMVLQIGNFPKSDQTKVSASQPTPGAPAEPTPTPAPGATPVPQQQQPDVITLVVSPQDAVTLNYLIYSGAELTLALRSAKDDTRVQTEAVTLQFLLEQYNIPVPARLPYSMEPRIDAIVAPVLTNDIKPTPQK